jgi:hypothetical protein
MGKEGLAMKGVAYSTVVVLCLFTNCWAQRTDGGWWASFEETLLPSVRGNIEEAKTIALVMRNSYVAGVKEGMTILAPHLRALQESEQGKGTIYRTFVAMLTVDPEQYLEGLKKFYQDYRNKQILVSEAMAVVAVEIKGWNEQEIEWLTRYMRTDESQRTRMIQEKDTEYLQNRKQR